MSCRCGAEVVRQEIRVISRCARGHIVGSAVRPAVVKPGELLDEPPSPPQLRGIWAKGNRLDQLLGHELGSSRRVAFEHLGVQSEKQLTSASAHKALDWLQAELEHAGGQT